MKWLRKQDDLQTIIHKAIEHDPQHRYKTAGEMAEDLQRFIHDEPIQARRISLPERFIRWSRRNRALAGSLSALAMLVTVVAVGSTLAAGYFRGLSKQLRVAKENAITEAATSRDLAQQKAIALEQKDQALARSEEATAQLELSLVQVSAAQKEADRQKKLARQAQYASTMQAVSRMVEQKDAAIRLPTVLGELRPAGNEPDSRGWEWYFANSIDSGSQLTIRSHNLQISRTFLFQKEVRHYDGCATHP